MSYLALARKWRPPILTEMVGQTHAVKTLNNAIKNNRVHHAWLITGTRGVGKTTLARAFAKALNCKQGISDKPCGKCECCTAIDKGNFMDLIEVDAASKTGVEDTRSLLENISYAPKVGRYTVYLIDEVHMFSNASFNALLKTLEEPPAHIKFLLATTDPQKLPTTIISRCIQLKLVRLDVTQIDNRLQHILQQEKIPFDKEATELLAYSADGSMRDALSLLDQAIAMGGNEVRQTSVQGILGLSADINMIGALEALANRDGQGLLKAIRQMIVGTSQFQSLLQLWLEYFHQLTLLQQVGEKTLNFARIKDPKALLSISKKFSLEELHLLYHLLLQGQRDVKESLDHKGSFEMLILRLLAFRPTPVEQANKDSHPREEQPKKKLTKIETSAEQAPSTQAIKADENKQTTPEKTIQEATQKLLKKADNQQWKTFLLSQRGFLPSSVWYYLRRSELVNLDLEADLCKLTLAFSEDIEESTHETNIVASTEKLAKILSKKVEIQWQNTSSEGLDTLKSNAENDLINLLENDENFKRIDDLLKLNRLSQSTITHSKK